IVGPTAAGKTAYGLKLAQKLGGEIVSVDSRQVYQSLQVGTSKPEGIWQAKKFIVEGVPYHLVDIWDPASRFTAADFVNLASKLIIEIRKNKTVPILVGGTGLYFKALHEGLAPLP